MNISDNLKKTYESSLNNSGKIDSKGFEKIKSEVLNDNQISVEERSFLQDKLAEGKFDKGVVPAVLELFSEKFSDKNQMTNELFGILTRDDNKVDNREWPFLKKELLSDSKIDDSEKSFLTEKLAEGNFTVDIVPEVIKAIGSAKEEAKPETKSNENKPTESKPPEKKPEKEEEKSKWEHKLAVRGGFSSTNTSENWSQYGQEKTSTKFEGAFEGELNYVNDKHRVNNKLLVEYGKVVVKDGESTISRDNQTFSSEYTYQIVKKDKLSVEIPYVRLFTQGPMTELGNRSFRESSGLKVVYDNPDIKGKYSVHLGGGVQETHNKEAKKWDISPGVELIVEAKQRLGFISKPYAEMSQTSQDNVDFLDKLELNASANIFAPLKDGFSSSTMDVTVNTGAKLFINKSESVWLGAGHQLRFGGKETSSWESRLVTDIGFKF